MTAWWSVPSPASRVRAMKDMERLCRYNETPITQFRTCILKVARAHCKLQTFKGNHTVWKCCSPYHKGLRAFVFFKRSPHFEKGRN